MKTYVVTTGVLFGLLTVVHLWRMVLEGPHVAKDPWFAVFTGVSAALCIWSWRLLRRSTRA